MIDVDSPELILPRIMDINGMLRRLEFEMSATRKVSGERFRYRRYVSLKQPELIERKLVTHVRIELAFYTDWDLLGLISRLSVRYGRVLVRDTDRTELPLIDLPATEAQQELCINWDNQLRHAEKAMERLIRLLSAGPVPSAYLRMLVSDVSNTPNSQAAGYRFRPDFRPKAGAAMGDIDEMLRMEDEDARSFAYERVLVDTDGGFLLR